MPAYSKVLQAVSWSIVVRRQYRAPNLHREIMYPPLPQCLSHDSRLLKESTWKIAEADAWKGQVKMPSKLVTFLPLEHSFSPFFFLRARSI